MRQYTNPTITCYITPADILTGITEIGVYILQDATGVEVVRDTLQQVVIDPSNGTVSVALTRDETRAFAVGPALIQVTGKTGAKYWASDIAKITVKRNLAVDGGVVNA